MIVVSTLQGLYFVAATQEEADSWIDGLTLASHLAGASRLNTLRQTLAPALPHAAASNAAQGGMQAHP